MSESTDRSLFYLDLPVEQPSAQVAAVAGWIGGATEITQVFLERADGLPPIALRTVERPDVVTAYPLVRHIVGFLDEVPSSAIGEAGINITYLIGGREHRFNRRWTNSVFPELKAAKLARIAGLLRTELPHRRSPQHFDFLTSGLKETYNIIDTSAVSSNSYDAVALGLISQHFDGLILDAGAGFTRDYRANVVNFEIVPYPSTDVVGVGEELPFRDGSFDAVFSLAVLEHVKDPFRCAMELQRVLKPGGTLYAVVPFLQPYHGYPHHYYNMTHQGLANLFPALRVESQGVPASGLPIWSLTWFLQNYARSLPEKTQERFKQLTIGDLLCNPVTLLQQDFVTSLPAEANLNLASTTMLVATKPLG